MRAQMEMRDGMGAREKGATDFTTGRITARVKDARAAVSGFAGEGEFRGGAVEAIHDPIGKARRATPKSSLNIAFPPI